MSSDPKIFADVVCCMLAFTGLIIMPSWLILKAFDSLREKPDKSKYVYFLGIQLWEKSVNLPPSSPKTPETTPSQPVLSSTSEPSSNDTSEPVVHNPVSASLPNSLSLPEPSVNTTSESTVHKPKINPTSPKPTPKHVTLKTKNLQVIKLTSSIQIQGRSHEPTYIKFVNEPKLTPNQMTFGRYIDLHHVYETSYRGFKSISQSSKILPIQSIRYVHVGRDNYGKINLTLDMRLSQDALKKDFPTIKGITTKHLLESNTTLYRIQINSIDISAMSFDEKANGDEHYLNDIEAFVSAVSQCIPAKKGFRIDGLWVVDYVLKQASSIKQPLYPSNYTQQPQIAETVNNKDTTEYVYCLVNDSFEKDLIKIGMTTQTPQKRAYQISRSTGVPTPFKVYCSFIVKDCQRAEAIVHNELSAQRVSNKEFFKVDLLSVEDVVRSILKANGQYIGEGPNDF